MLSLLSGSLNVKPRFPDLVSIGFVLLLPFEHTVFSYDRDLPRFCFKMGRHKNVLNR